MYRLVFIDLLARFRSEGGLPPIRPARVARMSDDELFEAVREVRAARDAKIRSGSGNETSANAARAQRKGGRGRCP
jgi:hypothetical protein